MRRYAMIGLAVLGLAASHRTYHVVSVAALAANDPPSWQVAHTHVEVDGWLTYKKREEDGDWHLRLCDSPKVEGMDRKRCVVTECIPLLPCNPPKLRSHVRARGVYRYDGERGHLWAEVHPLEYLEVIR